MTSIELLGGPHNGRMVEVDSPVPQSISRVEWVRSEEPSPPMTIRKWATSWGHKLPPKDVDIPEQVKHSYQIYLRWVAAGSPAHQVVHYQFCYWGNPWREHYVHPNHPVAAFAEALF